MRPELRTTDLVDSFCDYTARGVPPRTLKPAGGEVKCKKGSSDGGFSIFGQA
jgi:hypothetical protein